MIYRKGATQIDQCAHRIMEYQISPDWHGSTVVGDYIAFYHEERLYTVRHLKKGISCLVYARSPYDAIEKVRAIDATDVMEKLADVRPVVLCKDCKHNKGARAWRFLDLEDVTADCSKGHGYPPMDWFCADGEKREES